MEFLVISNSKIKIMLDKRDMEEYGINATESDYSDPQIRRAFWRILDAARDRCGFDVSGDKILIQFYPSGEGSEVFVTKLGKIGSAAERSISKSQNVAMLSSRPSIYRFPDISTLITASRHLPEEATAREARLYFSDDGSYYLMLEERTSLPSLSELSLLGEFATEVPYTLEPYIIEHSEEIPGVTALSVLSVL